MTLFAFLQVEWPAVYEAAEKAASAVYPDPRAACFYARRALELAVAWAYKYDTSLRLPYQDNLSALIHEPTFKIAAGEYVDYVLWGSDGKPLAAVEAKRTRLDPRVGQHQAKLYADCLEVQFGQRPVIFYSNGYEHWLWDDARYPPRQVQGFYKKAELELAIQRRESRKSLAKAEINPEIVERYYQTRSIRRIGEAFERDCDRKALVVMATGAGKTRSVIALVDLLMRCNWAKRVLFLASPGPNVHVRRSQDRRRGTPRARGTAARRGRRDEAGQLRHPTPAPLSGEVCQARSLDEPLQ